MSQNIIVIGFDMETDVGSWSSEELGVKEGSPKILDLLKGHDVPATFLFTGLQAHNNPDVVNRIQAEGHEIGCHTMYHETVGKPVYNVPVGGFILEDEIKGRLELATQVIEKVAGTRPVSFRAPRLFGSTAMMTTLEELGYKVDSSFPAYFHGRDFHPYYPSRDDWTREGDMDILELPVFYDMDAEGDDEKNRSRDQWPLLRLSGADRFIDLCRRMSRRARGPNGNSVLCMYLHPWEFVKMPRRIVTDESTILLNDFLHENTGTFALRALDEFLRIMKQDGCLFMTMKEFAASLASGSA